MSLARRTPTADAARERTEALLLEATMELLGEGATFGDLPIDQITSRAGYSRATFYAYFRDKRALVLRLAELFERDVHTVTGEWFDGRSEDVPGTLRALLDVFASHRATVKALVESAGADEAVGGFWRAFHERFRVIIAARILRGHPTLQAGDADARAFALVWMTERSFSEHLAAPVVDDRALIDALTLLWTAGLERRG